MKTTKTETTASTVLFESLLKAKNAITDLTLPQLVEAHNYLAEHEKWFGKPPFVLDISGEVDHAHASIKENAVRNYLLVNLYGYLIVDPCAVEHAADVARWPWLDWI